MDKIILIILAFLLIIAFSVIGCFILFVCWNSTMPELFALKTITLWQAFKLCLISQILFKGSSSSSSSKK